MKRKILGLTLALALLFFPAAGFVGLAAANAIWPIPEKLPVNQAYILSNGTVNPSTAPIQREGNTYFLTRNLENWAIEIQRSNIQLIGNGFSMSVPSFGEVDENGFTKIAPALISIKNLENVTVKGLILHNADVAIEVVGCSNITLTENAISYCEGILVRSCTSCLITENVMNYNVHALYNYGDQDSSSNLNIKNNNISDSKAEAIDLKMVSNSRIIGNIFERNRGSGAICHLYYGNRVIGNIFENNLNAIYTETGYNVFYHNNFINQTDSDAIIRTPNIWDDGKQGNYWSSHPNNTEPLKIGSLDPSLYDTDNFPQTTPYIFDYRLLTVNVSSPTKQSYPVGNLTLTFITSKEITGANYTLDGIEKGPLSNGTMLAGLAIGAHNVTIYAQDIFEDQVHCDVFFAVSPAQFPWAIVVGFSLSIAVAVGLLIYYFNIKKAKRKP